MNMKFLFIGFVFFWSLISCADKVLESPTMPADQTKTPSLKSASINYYVATTGSDNNPGTSASPFKTIQKAANIVAPGDTVIVKDGVYPATSIYTWHTWIACCGTADNYITFRSEHKWGAVLTGGDTYDQCFMLYNAPNDVSYIKFIDFDIQHFQGSGVSCTNDYSNYIVIQGNKIHDFAVSTSMTIKFPQGVFLNPKNHHWNIDKNLIYNIGGVTPSDYYLNKAHAVYSGTPSTSADAAHHNSITNNIIFGISGCALNLCSNNDLIANNVFAWSDRKSVV